VVATHCRHSQHANCPPQTSPYTHPPPATEPYPRHMKKAPPTPASCRIPWQIPPPRATRTGSRRRRIETCDMRAGQTPSADPRQEQRRARRGQIQQPLGNRGTHNEQDIGRGHHGHQEQRPPNHQPPNSPPAPLRPRRLHPDPPNSCPQPRQN
jgi:hypothetical protein